MAFGISAGTAALIGGGLALGGSLISANASSNAADTAASAANNASGTQLSMFNTINGQQAPYRAAGVNALNALTGAADTTMGQGPGYFAHQFDKTDLNASLAPNYDFQLQQGLGAVRNGANSQTGLLSGNTLKGINDYAQNYAGGAYQQAFQNYTANQTNIFNRLSNIAGLGQTANWSTANAGTTAAGNSGNSQIAAGQAGAAGITGVGNALSGGLNSAAGWYTLPQILNMGNGGSSSNFTQSAASNPTNSYIYGNGSLSD